MQVVGFSVFSFKFYLWLSLLSSKQKAVANCVWMLVVKIEGIERIY